MAHPHPIFDESLPVPSTRVPSEELRMQFPALKYLIDFQAQQIANLQATVDTLTSNSMTVDNSSANSNSVDVATVDVADRPSQQNVADLRDKLNELINGWRR